MLDRPAPRLFLTSAVVLFVELLLIRWIPANVAYVGFFNNFLLMASFLGIGIGILVGRRSGPGMTAAAPPLLLALALLVVVSQVNVRNDRGEIWFATSEQQSLDVNFVVLPLAIGLTTLLMALLAVPLAALLRAMPPLRAYGVDISGSLAGIGLFAALSAAGAPPSAWFAVAAGLFILAAFALLGRRARLIAAACLAGVFMLSLGNELLRGDTYSPYYRLNVVRGPRVEVIFVNGLSFQAMFPAEATKEAYYDQIYRWFPGRTFRRALIVGSGSGTDVSEALAHDVARVDAVEIDPGILAIGRARHPDAPYSDPRVTTAVADGRAFLRNSTDRYDLIVFAVTDSLTLVSSTSNLRLESFLFTDGAFAAARDHLTDDGVFVMYNYYREPWLVRRYARMVADVFGHVPITRTYPSADFGAAAIAAGPLVRTLGGAAPPGDRVEAVDLAGAPEAATDDRPFPYLEQRAVPPLFLIALAFMVGFAAVCVGVAARGLRTSGATVVGLAHFAVLGAAFLLLETRSIVTFSLLFGTTWYVNALVFFAILLSVLAAVLVNLRLRPRDARPLYAGLAIALAINFLLPPASLLFDPPALRYAVAAAIAFAPVFFANLVFTYSFRDTDAADLAFGANLLGAMVGGVLEWAALVTGYQALLLLVAVLYGAAWWLRPGRPVLTRALSA